MAAQIKIVDEAEIAEGQAAAQSQSFPLAPPDPRVVEALQNIAVRLAAAESAVQSVPKAIGVIGMLLRALGARVLMFFALAGCVALAAMMVLQSTWQGLIIFIAFAVLVYLPLAYIASRGN